MSKHRVVIAAGVAALVGCGRGDADRDVVRGKGLQLATLPVAERAAVYRSALRAAFDIGPSLVLLLHPRQLPRTAGLAGGAPVPAELAAALESSGIVQGRCDVPDESAEGRGGRPTQAPRCEARLPGYVVRFSDVFRRPPDSVQVYVEAERFATAASGPAQPFRFEKAYQLVGGGTSWRVAREGRVTETRD